MSFTLDRAVVPKCPAAVGPFLVVPGSSPWTATPETTKCRRQIQGCPHWGVLLRIPHTTSGIPIPHCSWLKLRLFSSPLAHYILLLPYILHSQWFSVCCFASPFSSYAQNFCEKEQRPVWTTGLEAQQGSHRAYSELDVQWEVNQMLWLMSRLLRAHCFFISIMAAEWKIWKNERLRKPLLQCLSRREEKLGKSRAQVLTLVS